LIPSKLCPKDKIGIISPASPVEESEIKKGIALLKDRGFKIELGENIYARDGYLAGSEEKRIYDLHRMFEDKQIKAIFCSRGGYGSLRLLDKIDYEIIKKNPKIFLGYSDITALLLAINKKTGLVTFHGPLLKDIHKTEPEDLKISFEILEGKRSVLYLSSSEVISSGKAEGRIFGGNLSVICHLIGTEFLPCLENSILFLEETAEKPYKIDRMFTYLRLSGIKEKIAALLLGSFDVDKKALLRIISDFIRHDIPVMINIPVGHRRRNIVFPLGIRAEVDTEKKILRFLEDPVR